MESPPMQVFGQRLGARNVNGLANWSDETIEAPTTGMTNFSSRSPHPKDGMHRRAEILMRDYNGMWIVVAYAFYDGQCRLERYEVLQADAVARDQRIADLVKRYAGKVTTLDCLSQQRDYPLQSPWHSWLLLRPGDVEVVA